MGSEEEQYQKVLPFMEEAAKLLGKHIGGALAALGDPYLVRGRVDSHRIKRPESIKRKAKRKKWTFDEALEKATDLVGYRLICNNLQDVERASDLLEQALKSAAIKVGRQDHIKKPKRTGYSALHLDIQLPVSLGGEQMTVGCEVQIRSLLQDSWARLSRADLYTAERSLSSSLRRTMKRLAQLLSVADQIAEDIREEISRPRRAKRPIK